jgi:hypothetical protein
MKKTAEELALFAEKVLREKWLYKYGAYGQNINGTRYSDCYGVRKACSWDVGNTSLYNASDDRNARTAYWIATVKGNIDTIPDVRGILVGKSIAGVVYHAGIYVGKINGIPMVIDIYKKDLPARLAPLSNGWNKWWQDTSIEYVVVPVINNGLDVDGIFGTETIKMWQKVMATPATGEISATGSTLIKAVQKFLNNTVNQVHIYNMTGSTTIPVNGNFDTVTKRVLVYYLMGVDSGAFDSKAKKALQIALNKAVIGSRSF